MRSVADSFLRVLLVAAAIPSAASDPHAQSVRDIFDWVNSAEDGFVSHKQTVRRMVENDTDTPLGVFATEDIKKGELLVQTPWSHILKSKNVTRDNELGWYCGTADTLKEEMAKGADSFYAPYSTYCKNEPDNQLPLQYSPKAKELLWEVLGYHDDEVNRSPSFNRDDAHSQRLMPSSIDEGLENHWYDECQADREDILGAKAASLVIQRADDFILIPAYDAYNHRNNDPHNGVEYMNAQTKTTMGKHHQTFALRDIKKGEQIYISYNLCKQCGGRKYYGFGTGEMYREYGFVEWFPQRWYFPGFGDYDQEENDMELNQFDLYQNEDTKDLTVVWTHLSKKSDNLDKFFVFLGEEIKRLRRLKNIKWKDMYSWNDEQWKESGITPWEWSNLNQFIDAYNVAITLAHADIIRVLDEDDDDDDEPLTVTPEALESLLNDGSHYDWLEESEKDTLGYYKFTCDNTKYYNFDRYVDTELAFYSDQNQLLGFFETSFLFEHEGGNEVDVCMDLDNIVQMCSAYRPYHHEYMTHAAARYVESVKRVAFVGNGYSMLLHEIMKYPDIELVVGLELDQTVTRKSFKHFKTDPYFHDPRVDWWFADVTKSLLVLPESYWESFDLVLVDFSENILDYDLTEDLTVFDALARLVKPDTGVIAQNELYLAKTSETFDYSMELFYQSPYACSETVAVGSNGVDFFHAPIYDHGIDGMNNILYTASYNREDNRHKLMHDYRNKAKKNCLASEGEDDTSDKEEVEEEKETSAYGVLEVVTLEEITTSPDSIWMKHLDDSLESFIEAVGGFTIVENGKHYEKEPHRLGLVVMEEGYVAGRVQQNENAAADDPNSFYIAIDIYLWSQTHRIGELKDAFRRGYGSQDVSSHKIVVSGVHGTKTWKEDSKRIGPNSVAPKKVCNSPEKVISSGESSSTFDAVLAGRTAIEEVVSLTLTQAAVAAVFCGKKEDACASLDVLKDHKNVKHIVEIYDCIADENDNESLYACEREIIEQLKKSSGKLNMVVLDSNASQAMHGIANSIFDTHEHRERFLAEHSIAVTWSSNDALSSYEPWRWEFLDRFRKQIHHDPVKLAEFVIRPGDGTAYQFGVVSTYYTKMNGRLYAFEKKLQSRLPEGTSVKVEWLHGGLYNYVENHNSKEFSQLDYDHTLAEKHFKSQIPLARQTVFQYQKAGLDLDKDSIEKLILGTLKDEGLIGASANKYQYHVADGCVFLLLGDTFNIITVWDGRTQFVMNLFGFSSQSLKSPQLVTSLHERIRGRSSLFTLGIDSQPRGLGRVVNFPEDLSAVGKGKLAETIGSRTEEEEEEEDDDFLLPGEYIESEEDDDDVGDDDDDDDDDGEEEEEEEEEDEDLPQGEL